MLQTYGVQDREQAVKQLFIRLDPQPTKGLKITDDERAALLMRLDQLRAEIVNASLYQGAVLK